MSRKDRGRKSLGLNRNRLTTLAKEPNRRSWPIVRAYVPIEDAWKASGWGTAGIVRRQPDEKLAFSLFLIDLSSGGLLEAFGAKGRTDEELEAYSGKMIDLLPPFEVGDANLAARYVWGSYAMSLAEGAVWSPQLIQGHLDMLPTIGGTKKWWEEQFLGPRGLVPDELFEMVADILDGPAMPEKKERVTPVSMIFDPAQSNRLLELLRARPGEFDEFEHGPEAVRFNWMRERIHAPGEWAIHGLIEVMEDEVFGHTANLSMAARLVGELKRLTDGAIKLLDVQWGDIEDLKFVPPGLTVV